MGRNSQRRRAAKLRKQQDRRRFTGARSTSLPNPDATSTASPVPPAPPPAPRPATRRISREEIDRHLDAVLSAGTAHALAQGWSGADLIHRARDKDVRLDELQARYLSSNDGVDVAIAGAFVEAWCAQQRDRGSARVRAQLLAMSLLDINAIPPRRRAATTRANVDVLAKVRALLAKAEATTFPAEAEAFTAKAQELMSRHAIDEAMVAASSDLREADRSMSVGRVLMEEPYLNQQADLLRTVAHANACRAVTHGRLGIATIVGESNDVDMVELLFTSLLLQATVAMHEAGRHHAEDRTRGFRSSFLTSFAIRIGQRLTEARRVATEEGAQTYGSALVPVLAAKEERVEVALHELFPNLTSSRRSQSFDPRGWDAGRVAADRADVGSSRRIAS